MKIFALLALAVIASTPAIAAAPKHTLTAYEKACGKQPNAKELADCAKQLKECEANFIKEIKLHPGDYDKGSSLEACRQSIFEDADSGKQ